MVVLQWFQRERYEEGACVHLGLRFPDARVVSFTIDAWSNWIDEYAEPSASPSSDYCFVSEDGHWVSEGLKYCGLIGPELIFEWEPGVGEEFGFTPRQRIELNLSDEDRASLWQGLLEVLDRPELTPIAMEVRSLGPR
ncbi:hypothetical protein GCM10029978_021590 [Actinoallomurus acanthiterrae]